MTECAIVLHGHQPFYNEEFIVKEIIWQSYGPLFKRLMDASKHHQFQINLSLTGSVLQWFERLNNDFLLSSIGELLDRGIIEILLSPFYHAPFVFTNDGFLKEQFYHHRKMVKDLFGKEMRGLFPPEMIYSTHKNQLLLELDIDYLFVEGDYNAFSNTDVEGVWKLNTSREIFALARNRALSWHFSDNTFPNAQWLLETLSKKEKPATIGCDVECFGHHRGEDSFKFLDYFLEKAKQNNVELLAAGEIIKNNKTNAQLYLTEDITTWARNINVFFPHSKIIEMWFAKNEVVTAYHQIEHIYFSLEKNLQRTNKDDELLKQLINIKNKDIDDIRWNIHRELTDAALYHNDFSNVNTYRAFLDCCSWIKNRIWNVEKELTDIFKVLL